jgi:hypothetical protein
MQTECSAKEIDFGRADGRRVVADFDGGMVSSDAGALLLGETDKAIRLVERFSACFHDQRDPIYVAHAIETLVAQRVFGLALGYEDLIDHDELRLDPVLGALLGKLGRAADAPAPLAGKSTLNRLEHAPPEGKKLRYHKIGHEAAAIEKLFVDLFLDAHAKPPREIVLDLDVTDDPLHGAQEGRFFHGYYDCYCYLPLYVFCGRHLLAAKLRRSNIDGSAGSVDEMDRIVAQIRAGWPKVKIILRADSGFAREALMRWCRQPRGLCLRPRAQRSARGAGRGRALDGARPLGSRLRQAGARLSRLSVDDEGLLVAPTPGDRQGGVDRRRGQSALRRHLVEGRRLRRAAALRGFLLRARRDGEPHQGGAGRPLRRPHIDCDDARQPIAAVVLVDGLCSLVRPATHRPRAHPVRKRDLRHDPSEAAEARSAGEDQRPPGEDLLRFRLSVGRGLAPVARPRLSGPNRVAAARSSCGETQGSPETEKINRTPTASAPSAQRRRAPTTNSLAKPSFSFNQTRDPGEKSGLIPTRADLNRWAQSRSPMDMMRQGCSASLFQASQQ